MKKISSLFFVVVSCLLITNLGSNTSMAGDPQGKAIGYWTKARLDSAQSIELSVDSKSGQGKLVRELRGSTNSSNKTSSGTNWTLGGDPLNLTGKVFFSVGSTNYVCSGSYVNDALTSESIVLTAGHCVWDQATQAAVTNFIFFPAYQASVSKSCTDTTCFYGKRIYLRNEFATQSTFNTTSLLNDWGFVVVNGDSAKSFPISFSNSYTSGNVSSLGYPQVNPYNGLLLINCQNPPFKDVNTSNRTWGISCNMTGGASGGPWIYPWNTKTYSGTLFSLNSYKYNGDSTRMYGPMFNGATSETYIAANGGAIAPNVKKI